MPGGTVSWQVGVAVPDTSAGDLVNPTVTDCLPVGLDLLDPFTPSSPINGTSSGFSVAPTVTRTPNGCGAANNQVLITWSWTGGFTLARGQSGTFTLNTLVAPGTPPASVQNVASLTSDSLSTALQRIADLAITSETLLRGEKEVRGDRDTGFLSFPGIGNTTRGGFANYRATIRNVSDVAVSNVIVVDTLPIPGDIGLKDPAPRGSQWQPLFAGELTSTPPAASVMYSTAHNPCRDDLSVQPPGCVPANWTLEPRRSGLGGRDPGRLRLPSSSTRTTRSASPGGLRPRSTPPSVRWRGTRSATSPPGSTTARYWSRPSRRRWGCRSRVPAQARAARRASRARVPIRTSGSTWRSC